MPHASSLTIFQQRPPKAAAAAAVAVTLALVAISQTDTLSLASIFPRSPESKAVSISKPIVKAKAVSDSSFTASYAMHPEMADGSGRVFGGEILKLVDVVAGIACRRHSGGPCVTISLDRVIFLAEVAVGDILHLSVSVNRAWGSSMEAGVRITKEAAISGVRSFACHAYLTFVARPHPSPPAPPRPFLVSILSPLTMLSASPSPKRNKPQLPMVQPQTVLEHKRHILAGRRRGHRMQRHEAWEKLLTQFRNTVLDIERNVESSNLGDGGLEALQLEMVADAYARGNGDVKVKDGMVVAKIEGYMEPVSASIASVEKVIAQRRDGAFRRLSVARSNSMEPSPVTPRFDYEEWGTQKVMAMEETVASSVQIVRPQHANSMGVLFGGVLMRWLEEVAALSARRISAASWSTVTADSMTFRAPAHPGHVVKLRSVVIKVWDSSVECYSVATAENHHGPDIFISDAFFSLVAIDSESGRPMKGNLRKVEKGEGAVGAMMETSEERRKERLEGKAVLQRVYS